MQVSRQLIDGLIIAAMLALGARHLYAEGIGGRKMIHANQAGAVTCSAVRGAKGPNGGMAIGERDFAADGQGIQHRSGGAISGARGSASSSGSMTTSADGSVSGSRHTSAQAISGATYAGGTTYEKKSGVSHTGTCTNAADEVVSCAK